MLLHGFAQSGATWRGTVATLESTGYRVLVPNLGGRRVGDAEATADAPLDPAAYTFAGLVDFLEDLLDREEVDRVNLVGYSMGGRVALHFALVHPERLASLVLESAGLGPRDTEERAAYRRRDAALVDHLRNGSIEGFVDRWEELPIFATQKNLSAEARACVREERLANDPEVLAYLLEGAGQHVMPDLRPCLSGITVPMLYLAGSRDAKYRMLSEELGRAYDISVHRFDTGHDIHLEDSASYSATLREFYARNDL